MSAVEDNLTVGAEAEPQFRRPVWPVGVLMDALLGIAAYLAAYWLRFHGGSLATFIPGVWSTAPLVVSAQVLVLALLRAYARLPKGSWLTRVAVGTVLGTLAGTGLVAVTRGFNGVVRSSRFHPTVRSAAMRAPPAMTAAIVPHATMPNM